MPHCLTENFGFILLLFGLILLAFQLPIEPFIILSILSGWWFGPKMGGGVGFFLGFALDSWTGFLGVHTASHFFLGFVSGWLRKYVTSPALSLYLLWMTLGYGFSFLLEWAFLSFSLRVWYPVPLGATVARFSATLLASILFYSLFRMRFREG